MADAMALLPLVAGSMGLKSKEACLTVDKPLYGPTLQCNLQSVRGRSLTPLQQALPLQHEPVQYGQLLLHQAFNR